MVSKKAVIGIGVVIFVILFISILTALIVAEAERLQISFNEALRVVIFGGTGFGGFDCTNNNCYPIGTEIENTCNEFDSTRSCTIQTNSANLPREIEEKEGVIIILGIETKCFYPNSPSTGDEITDKVLLCRDDARFDKKWWVLGEESVVGLDQFITINVIGDQSFGDRTSQLQGMGLIGIP